MSQEKEYTIVADKNKLETICHRGYGVEIHSMDGAYEERSHYELNGTVTVDAFVRDYMIFKGRHYIDGNLLSKSYKYTVPQRTDCTLIAKTSSESYYGYEPVRNSMPENMNPYILHGQSSRKITGTTLTCSPGRLLSRLFMASPGSSKEAITNVLVQLLEPSFNKDPMCF